MLGQDYTGQPETVKDQSQFRNFAGYILLIMGVIGGLWIFSTVYSIFKDPMELTLFQRIVEDKLNVVINHGQGKIDVAIPKEFLTYAVPIGLLVIAAGIAGTFVSAGVRLLVGDIQKLRRRIDAVGERIEKKFDKIKTLKN
jgi:hypothetical protein